MESIRVVVVDDHALVRESVSAALHETDDIEVIASCVDGADACQTVAELHPDVVLMDLSMPRMDGVEATRRIVENDPAARVVLFTSGVSGQMIQDALRAGASSCVFKSADLREIARALREAAR